MKGPYLKNTVLFCVFLSIATQGISHVKSQSVPGTYRLLYTLNEVFRTIRQESVAVLSDEILIEGAMNGMLKAVDPYSYYIPPEQYKNMLTDFRGEIRGVGLEITQEGDNIKVITPFEGSPAWEAGVKPGDYIITIHGKPVQGLSLFAVADLMQLEAERPLVIQIKREGVASLLSVTLKRKKIILKNVRWHMEDRIAYLRLSNFNHRSTSSQLKNALEKILVQNPEGIVLDLRNNPGGLLEEVLPCINFFVNSGILVQVEPRQKKDTQHYKAKVPAIVPTIPLIVLINEGTASCAEIMAGSLQDHRRALILGVPSFGKARVQSILPLSPGYAAIQLTTAYYLTPSGHNIEKVGIQPDIIVKEGTVPGEDLQKREAVRLLKARAMDKKGDIS